jgi:hypothetical protein
VKLNLGGPTAPLDAPDPVLHAAVPVVGGRLSLGRLRHALAVDPPGPLAVCAGLRSACWLGPPQGTPPGLGRLVHQGTTHLDARGRVALDRHVRGYLGVADPAEFAVVLVSLPTGGVLVLPVEGIDERAARVRLA